MSDRPVQFSNVDKVLFPESGLTKGDLIDYYRRVAERLLPYAQGRPLVVRRWPDGLSRPGFFQKGVSGRVPDWVATVAISKREGGEVLHAVLDGRSALLFFANQAAIELHALLAPAAEPERPDLLIIDLDPSTSDPGPVVEGARILRRLLDDAGVTAYVKSSGSRGLHIEIDLDGSRDFGMSSRAAAALAARVVAAEPAHFTTAHAKAERGDRLFVDTLRNGYGQHAVLPYSVRARPPAPVAVPLDWEEATSSRFDPQRFTIRNVFRRLGQKDDPWAARGADRYDAADLVERFGGGR